MTIMGYGNNLTFPLVNHLWLVGHELMCEENL